MRTLISTFVAVTLATVMLLAQGTLPVPYTADQEKGMQYGLDVENAHRASQRYTIVLDEDGLPIPSQPHPFPPLTLRDFGVQKCQEVFDGFSALRAQARAAAASVEQKYRGLSDERQDLVEAYIDSLLSP